MKKWGNEIPEKEKLQAIFDRFDVDKDGKISFNDLQKSMGKVLHPKCDEYFRQDTKETV